MEKDNSNSRLEGALFGAFLMPLMVGCCGFLSLTFFPFTGSMRIDPVRALEFYPGALAILVVIGAVFGALSGELWRGKRGISVRLAGAVLGVAIWVLFFMGGWYGVMPFSSRIRVPLLSLYIIGAAPLILWASALVFFAFVLRSAKQSFEFE